MGAAIRVPHAALIYSLIAITGFLVFGYAVGLLMQPAVQLVGMERTGELVCLQLAFTPERAADIVLGFPEAARSGIAALLVPGDLALAWGYGLLLAGLMALVYMRLPQPWLGFGLLAAVSPLLATALDCIENAFLYGIVTSLVDRPDTLPGVGRTFSAGVVSSLKWIVLSVVTPAIGLAGIVKGLTVDRSGPALLVYALLFTVLLSMVVKPLQDIPPCF